MTNDCVYDELYIMINLIIVIIVNDLSEFRGIKRVRGFRTPTSTSIPDKYRVQGGAETQKSPKSRY